MTTLPRRVIALPILITLLGVIVKHVIMEKAYFTVGSGQLPYNYLFHIDALLLVAVFTGVPFAAGRVAPTYWS